MPGTLRSFWTMGFAVCALGLLAAAPVYADPIPGNFWPNPTLETPSTTQDNAPAGWRRGGVDFQDPPNPGPYISAFWDDADGTVSPTHALRLTDSSATTNGEWLTPWFGPDPNIVLLPATGGDMLRFHFHRKFNTSTSSGDPADMRVTIRGHDGIGDFGLGNDFDFIVNGTSGGAFESVTFDRVIPAVLQGPNAGIMMIIATGGGSGVTGTLTVDEIYVARVPEPASAMTLLGAASLLFGRRRRR